MKYVLTVLSLILLLGCSTPYEKEEQVAINDVVNDFLRKNPLDHILNPHTIPGEKTPTIPNLDTLDLKIYISDALLPIAQIKEDNEWMFIENYSGQDSIIYYGIINSKRFKELKYREFDKSKLKLIEPFTQSIKSQIKVTADEEYTILNLSRVCFDNKEQNGVVVLEYLKGFEEGTMSGYHIAFLIKKKDNKWIYIPRE